MDVIMPQLGETVSEGTVSVWHKSIGDAVSTREPLFDVSSDKVEMEVPAPAEGTLLEIRVNAGTTVPVGEVIAIIVREGEVIEVAGRILDEDMRPVSGALVEIWNCNSHGRYAHVDDSNPAAALDPLAPSAAV